MRILFAISVLVLVAFLPQLAAAQTATFRGVVTDIDGQPLPGAIVVIPAAQLGGLTNDEGLFSIAKIPAGEHVAIIKMPGKDSLRIELVLSAGEVKRMDLVLNDLSTNVIEIKGQLEGKIETGRVDAGITSISAEEISYVPTLGTSDLATYLQVLPGVVFTGDQGGQLYVRGGTPIMNLVQFDGTIMYNAFHSIGLFSVFDTEYLRKVDVYSGGFPAQFGGRVSSVMDISTRQGSFREFAGKVQANPIMTSVLAEGPLLPKRGKELAPASFLVSARQCYLNQTSNALYSYANDTAGLPFNFTDLYGKVTFGSGANYASLFGFYQRDNVDYGFPANVGWEQTGGGLNFQFLPSNTQMILSGSVGVSSYSNDLLSPDENFPRTSSINGFTGRLNFSYILNSADELTYGIQMLGFQNDLRITNALGLLTTREDSNTEFAGFFTYKKAFRKKTIDPQGNVSFFTRAVLEPSVRLHYYNDQGKVSFEPRLRAKYNLNRLSFQFSTGLFSQNIITAVSDRDVVQLFQGYLAAPREDLLNQQRSDFLQTGFHLLGGVQLELIPGLKTEVEGWYKNFSQITNVNRNRLFPSDSRFIAEQGQAYGTDLILKYQSRKTYLYLTYGLAFNLRNDGTQEYAPVYDRRHNLNAVGHYKSGALLGKRTNRFKAAMWEFSARYQFGTGFPFTTTQGFFEKLIFSREGAQTDYLNQNGGLGLLLNPEINTGRLPTYHRLDLSAKRRWLFGEDLLLEVNANVINVYNRDNIFYFDRIRNAAAYQLPIMPTLGASFSW